MFNIKLNKFSHKASSNYALRSEKTLNIDENKEYLNVPQELHEYINLIKGVTDLPLISDNQINKLMGKLKTSGDLSTSFKDVTPAVIESLYKVDYSEVPTTTGP